MQPEPDGELPDTFSISKERDEGNMGTDTNEEQEQLPFQVPPAPTQAAPVVDMRGRKVPTAAEIEAEIKAMRQSAPQADQQASKPAEENPFSIVAVLGEHTYTIPKLTAKRAKVWRNEMRGPLDEILTIMNGAASFQIDNVADLMAVFQSFKEIVLSAPDTIVDLVFQYSPMLAGIREIVEDEAYDEQFIELFVRMVKSVFPLGQLTSSLGLSKLPIASSLPSPNGASKKTT